MTLKRYCSLKAVLLLTISMLAACGGITGPPTKIPAPIQPTSIPSTSIPPTNTPEPISIPTSTPLPLTTPTPTAAEEEAWSEIPCMAHEPLTKFIDEFPSGTNANEAKLFISLYQKMAAMEAKEIEPGFAIPFTTLGPRWIEWQTPNSSSSVMGYYIKPTGTFGVSFFANCAISFDAYGAPMAPTSAGSIILFRTGGQPFEYLNSIVFETDGDEVLYFGIVGSELVHLHGKGKVTLPNGNEQEL